MESSRSLQGAISCEDLNRITVVSEAPARDTLKTKQDSSRFYLRRRSTFNSMASFDSLRPKPSNMMRRWSEHISLFAKDKQAVLEKAARRLPMQRIRLRADDNGSNLSNEIDALAEEIENYESLMQNTPESQSDRLHILRTLPQPLLIRRMLKWKLCCFMEQQEASFVHSQLPWSIESLKTALLKLLCKGWLGFCTLSRRLRPWQHSVQFMESHYGRQTGAYFRFLRLLLLLNMGILLFITSFISWPQLKLNLNKASNLDISLLLNASYSDFDASLRKSYLLTILGIYLFTFLWNSISMSTAYRLSYVSSHAGYRKYAHNIFCSWDYRITSTMIAALRHQAICKEFKKMIQQDCKVTPRSEKRFEQLKRFGLKMLRLLLVVLGIGLACLLLKVICDWLELVHTKSYCLAGFCLQAIMIIMQYIYNWIMSLGKQKSSEHSKLLCCFITQLCLLFTLLGHWLLTKRNDCWEEQLAKVIQSLLLADLLYSLILVPAIYVGQTLLNFLPISKSHCHLLAFHLTSAKLNLQYSQTLLWVGLLYAPTLAALLVLKLLLLFYIHKLLILYCCRVQAKSQTLSYQIDAMQLVFSFVTLFIVLAVQVCIMTHLRLSSNCGPFRQYSYMSELLLHGIVQLDPHSAIGRLLIFLANPKAVGLIIVGLCIKVYYLHAKSQSHCRKAKLLRELLVWEAKDKQYLLMQLNAVRGRCDFKQSEMELSRDLWWETRACEIGTIKEEGC